MNNFNIFNFKLRLLIFTRCLITFRYPTAVAKYTFHKCFYFIH